MKLMELLRSLRIVLLLLSLFLTVVIPFSTKANQCHLLFDHGQSTRIKRFKDLMNDQFVPAEVFPFYRVRHLQYSVYPLLSDRTKFVDWVISIYGEAVDLMNQVEGQSYSRARALGALFPYYIDKVIARRAQKVGFRLKGSRPFQVGSMTSDAFLDLIRQRVFFYDRAGIFFFDREDETDRPRRHGMRSHMIQLLFVAEHLGEARYSEFIFDLTDRSKDYFGKESNFFYVFDFYGRSGLINPSWTFWAVSKLWNIKN